jgi:hypothetical protein
MAKLAPIVRPVFARVFSEAEMRRLRVRQRRATKTNTACHAVESSVGTNAQSSIQKLD